MKILAIEQGSDEWRSFKKGKVSGTRIGKLCAKSKDPEVMFDTDKVNQTYYEVLSERLTIELEEIMSPAERGIILQEEAIERFCEEKGISEDMVATDGVWQSDKNPNWICSPDAFSNTEKPTWAVEVKCLNSANHLKAILTNDYPSEYVPQVINYFLINENLDTIYFVMYDPRFVAKELQLKVFEVQRADVEPQIKALESVRNAIEDKMEDYCKQYSNF